MPARPIADAPQHRSGGLTMALTAYLLWGLLPLYMRQLHPVPALVFVGWRTVFTLPACLLLVTMRGEWGEVLRILRRPRLVAILALSASLIGSNWLIYVVAIKGGHVFATSLGYYILPLVNILLGTVFLHEKLGWMQWLAVALAGGGVALLALADGSADAHVTLVIALALCGTFAGYGLVRKLVPVGSLPGLSVEAGLLVIPGTLYLLIANRAGAPSGAFHFGVNARVDVLLSLSGLTTAIPLWLFAESARRMDYATMGFLQFLSPTVIFLLGLFVFHEPLRPTQLAAFVVIWVALMVFCWDMWAKRRSV